MEVVLFIEWGRMRVLLVSTYDLGRQPFGLASPAAWLRRAGVATQCVDTPREPLSDDRIAGADVVAFYLPMHTATRLAAPLIDRVRQVNPSARIAAYGLYAPLNAEWLRERGVTHVLGPEAEQELVALTGSDSGDDSTHVRSVAASRLVAGSDSGDGSTHIPSRVRESTHHPNLTPWQAPPALLPLPARAHGSRPALATTPHSAAHTTRTLQSSPTD